MVFVRSTSPSTTNQNCTSSYVQYFNELDTTGIDLTYGLKNEDIPKLETMNNVNPNVFEPNLNIKNDLSIAPKLLPISDSDGENESREFLWY